MTETSPLAAVLTEMDAADLSVLLGLRAALHAADTAGEIDRLAWTTAVAEEYRRWSAPRSDGGNSVPGGAEIENFLEEPTSRYLGEHVVPALSARGVLDHADGVHKEAVASPEGAAAPLRLTPWLLAEPRAELAREVDARIECVLARVETAPAAAPRITLSARGLVKIYRKRKVVNDVDLDVTQGEIVGLLGPNGAGKTTSFYMMVGLIAPDRGTVRLAGRDLTDVPMYKRARAGIGYLAQEPSIIRRLTVEENVLAILQMMPLSEAEQRRRLETLLDELSIKHLRKTYAYALSGGERRRLEITRALVGEPKFMLLDEPFAGVDPIAVHDIQQIVAGLRKRGIGVLISDHNVEQTLDIVDRAYIMYDGGVRVSGTVSELVWNEEVAEIYLGPTLTARMRGRYPRPESNEAA